MKFEAHIERVLSKPDNRVLLNNVSFRVESPGVIWVQGDNGTGKTVLTSILSGRAFLERPGFTILGEVLLEKDHQTYDVRRDTRAFIENISYLPQKLASSLLAIHFQDDICFSFEGSFPRFPGKDTNEKHATIIRNIDQLNNNMDLWLHLKKRIGEASYGETRRLEFACSLCPHASVLILDEPLSGLDPKWMKQILRDLQTVADNNDSILVITSHSSPRDYQIAPTITINLQNKIGKPGFSTTLNHVLEACRTRPLKCDGSISLSQFEVERQERKIININEFRFQPQRLNWIEGSNGSGKSTLLLFLAGLLKKSWRRRTKINGNVAGGPFEGWPRLAPNNENRLLLQNPYRSFIRTSVQEDLTSTPDHVKEGISLHWGDLKRRPSRFSFGQLKTLQFLLLPLDTSVALFDEPLLGIHSNLFPLLLDALDGIAKSGRYVIATCEENIINVKKYVKDTNILNIPQL